MVLAFGFSFRQVFNHLAALNIPLRVDLEYYFLSVYLDYHGEPQIKYSFAWFNELSKHFLTSRSF